MKQDALRGIRKEEKKTKPKHTLKETCRFTHGVFLKNTKEGRFLKKISFRM